MAVKESSKPSKLIESIDQSSNGGNSTGEVIDSSIDRIIQVSDSTVEIIDSIDRSNSTVEIIDSSIDRSIQVSDSTVEIIDSIDRSNSTVEIINRRTTGKINNRSIKLRDPSSQVES